MAKPRVLLALAIVLLAPTLIHAQASPEAEMVGTWRLSPQQEGDAAPGPGSIKLEIRLEAGKLTGNAVLPIQGGEKRWPIVNASFDGKTFSFTVDNGESLLSGTMERKDGGFEGHWVGGEEGGRLTMTRAEP
ncbi:MAG TPA: hypothetical protein VH394_27540 [Thermoanaerobaculia bacterium]|jgi:hypothetical protein|nr:hypothetical protein [Thermoanaerobaculia bacterium]